MVKLTKRVQEVPGKFGAVQGVVTHGAVRSGVHGFQSQAQWIKETQPEL
jgi:hypothetical protein